MVVAGGAIDEADEVDGTGEEVTGVVGVVGGRAAPEDVGDDGGAGEVGGEGRVADGGATAGDAEAVVGAEVVGVGEAETGAEVGKDDGPVLIDGVVIEGDVVGAQGDLSELAVAAPLRPPALGPELSAPVMFTPWAVLRTMLLRNRTSCTGAQVMRPSPRTVSTMAKPA